MTSFSGFVLFIIALYATINFFRIFTESRQIFHFCLGSAAIFLSIIGISDFLVHFFPVLNPDFIEEWSSVFSVSFVLSATAALIRDSKPAFTRFPRFFTFIPMLFVFFYPLVMDTLVLHVWIISLYQGSAIIIGLLIYGYKTYINPQFGYMLTGVIFFLITFILYMLPASLFTIPVYAWELIMASGILIVTVGYNQVYGIGLEYQQGGETSEQWFI